MNFTPDPDVCLVCRDDGTMSRVHEVLDKLGLTVRVAASVDDLMDGFAPEPCHCVIVDLQLPGLDVDEVCRRLSRATDLPVIALAGRGDVRGAVAAMRGGVADCVLKPIVDAVLAERVLRALGRAPRESPPG